MDSLKPFSKLDYPNTILKLDWFGGITSNLKETDNPLIDCYFTPLFKKNENGRHYYSRSIQQQFRSGMAVGYLPTLFLGQIYINGKQAEPGQSHKYTKEENIIFEIDTSIPSSVIDCHLDELKLITYMDLTAYKYKSLSDKAGLKKLNGELLHTDNTKALNRCGNKTDALEVYIHEMEIIRYYLTNSAHSCKKIFTGAFRDKRRSVEVFNNIHEVSGYNKLTGVCRFVYRHEYKRSDAISLGRILSEPDKYALKAAQKVFKKISADKINNVEGSIGYPRTFFPFRGKSQLKLSGRRIKTSNGKFIFLVSRIHSCSARLPYRLLSYCNELSKGGKPAPDDADTMGWKNKTKKPPSKDKPGQSVSDQPPDADSFLSEIVTGERIFADLKNVTREYVKLRDCTHKPSDPIKIRKKNNLTNVSTGKGTSGETNSSKLSITEDNVHPSVNPTDLKTFIAALTVTNKLNPFWKISTLCIEEGYIDKDWWYSYFPRVSCEKRRANMQFSFMNRGQSKLRSLIAAQIKIEFEGREEYMYIFEAQRRPKDKKPEDIKDGESPFKEDLPILLLFKNDYSKCEGSDFKNMLIQTVKNKTWSRKEGNTDFKNAITFHGGKKISERILGKRIKNMIIKNSEIEFPDVLK